MNITGLTNQAGSAANIAVIAGTPQSALVNTAFATAFQVKVTDSSGNPVQGATVTFTAPASDPSGNFSGSPTATAQTDSAGLATAPAFTAGTAAGSYQVTASAISLNAGLIVTNTAGSAAVMTKTAGDNQSVATGACSLRRSGQDHGPVQQRIERNRGDLRGAGFGRERFLRRVRHRDYERGRFGIASGVYGE